MPTLLAGMQSNAQAPDGAASLESALAQHRDGLVDGGVDASQVDTDDGEKIVSHVFGGQQDQVASQLAGSANLGGVGGDLVRKLLPILAPIVMSYLAKKILGGQNAGGGAGDVTGRDGSGEVQATVRASLAGSISAVSWAAFLAAARRAAPVAPRAGLRGYPWRHFGRRLRRADSSPGMPWSRSGRAIRRPSPRPDRWVSRYSRAVRPSRASWSTSTSPTTGRPGTKRRKRRGEQERRRPWRSVGRALREEIAALDSAQSSAQGWPESSAARTGAAAAAATWASHSSSSLGLRNAITGGMSGSDCHSLNTRFFLAKELKCQ